MCYHGVQVHRGPLYPIGLTNAHNPFWCLVGRRHLCCLWHLMLLLTLLYFCFHVYLAFAISASFQTRCLSRLGSSWVATFCWSCCLFVSLRRTGTVQMYYWTPFWEPKTLWVCFQPHISSCCISSLDCYLTWHLMHLFSNCSAIKRDIQTSLRGFQSLRLFLRKQEA